MVMEHVLDTHSMGWVNTEHSYSHFLKRQWWRRPSLPQLQIKLREIYLIVFLFGQSSSTDLAASNFFPTLIFSGNERSIAAPSLSEVARFLICCVSPDRLASSLCCTTQKARGSWDAREEPAHVGWRRQVSFLGGQGMAESPAPFPGQERKSVPCCSLEMHVPVPSPLGAAWLLTSRPWLGGSTVTPNTSTFGSWAQELGGSLTWPTTLPWPPSELVDSRIPSVSRLDLQVPHLPSSLGPSPLSIFGNYFHSILWEF